MGKVSERDFTEMAARLRARAGRILRQLDESAEVGYRVDRGRDRATDWFDAAGP